MYTCIHIHREFHIQFWNGHGFSQKMSEILVTNTFLRESPFSFLFTIRVYVPIGWSQKNNSGVIKSHFLRYPQEAKWYHHLPL